MLIKQNRNTIYQKIIILLVFQLILVSCGPDSPEVYRPTRQKATINGTPVFGKWPTSSFPLKFHVSEDFSDDEVNAIKSVAGEWSKGVNNRINFFEIQNERVIGKQSSSYESYISDGILGIYKRNNWFEGKSDKSIAITNFSIVAEGRGEKLFDIVSADIILNSEKVIDTTKNANVFNLESVILHEMGHVLGINHLGKGSEENVVMFTNLQPGQVKLTLADEDIFAIKDLYNLLGTSSSDSSDETQNEELKEEDTTIKFKKVIHGTAHLMEDGNCIHEINGKVVKKHKIKSIQAFFSKKKISQANKK